MTSTTDPAASLPRLSLLGGPIHRLGRRLGLVRGESNTVRLGLAVGLFLWLVLFALALLDGARLPIFSLSTIAIHVRMLVALPLLFIGETWLDPRLSMFITTLVRSRVVPPAALPRLAAGITRVRWVCDSWLVDLACLVAAVGLGVLGSHVSLPGETASINPARAAANLSPALIWYWAVCMTAFRFFALRWFVRLVMWTWIVHRITQLDLDLKASHPDRAGGLGYLEVVHMHFLPLVFAISTVEAAAFAEGIAAGTMRFESTYPAFAVLLGVDALLFLGPLLIVSPLLWRCRVQGLSSFAILSSDYVDRFDRKWVEEGAEPGEPVLGTADLQSLADLGNSSDVVWEMRWAPVSLELVRDLVIAALLPLFPLLLLEYPIAELTQRVLSRVTGL